MTAHDPSPLLQWVPRLRRYARVLSHRPEDADDLVQDTLERAWSRATLWPQVTDMRAWLFSVMHHLHVDRLRHPGPMTTPLDDDLPLPVHEAPGTLRLELEAALRRLSAEHREVLLLVAVEAMSYAEVAHTLGVPIGTVMSRLCRARERLRALMDNDPPGTHAAPPQSSTAPAPLKRVK